MHDERDEFEFKPLTDGLGFHKKVLELREEPVPMKVTSTTGIMPQPKRQAPSEPLKTPQTNPGSAPVAPRQPIHPLGWKPTLNKMDMVDKPKGPQLVPSPASAPAALFDTSMVLGMGLIFSAIVFALTRIEYGYLVEILQTDAWAQIAALVLFISVFEIYTVATRSFFGKTLGEWVFDFRLGTPDEQLSALYPLQVAWRSLAIALTGFIVLPAISWAIGKDIAGLISGVSLYAEKR